METGVCRVVGLICRGSVIEGGIGHCLNNIKSAFYVSARRGENRRRNCVIHTVGTKGDAREGVANNELQDTRN